MVDVRMRISAVDERPLGQVVVPKVARPTDRIGAVRPRAMNQEGREDKHIALLDLDRLKIAVAEAIDFSKTLDDFTGQQAQAVAGRHDFERAQAAVDIMQWYPNDSRIERPLHAPPILMREHPPIDFLRRQVAAVE